MNLSEDVLKSQAFQSLELEDFWERDVQDKRTTPTKIHHTKLLHVINPLIELIGYSITQKRLSIGPWQDRCVVLEQE